MDIGTDKVSREARERVPHHGLDLVAPSERYSAGRFARDARRWIREIEERDRVPMLVGGTGFFLRAVTDPVFREPPLERDRLRDLRRYLAEQSRERLASWVGHLDPDRAALAREGGPQRMSRTLEVPLLTGRALSWWHRNAGPDAEPVRGLIFVLSAPRETLDARIAKRVDRMFARGLEAEVSRLVEAGYGPGDPGMSGTGYHEVADLLRGEVDREEAKARIRSATRRYARRQMTWFRNQLPTEAVHLDATEPVRLHADRVVAAWEEAGRAAPSTSQPRKDATL